jgi:hypothetical protein
MTAAMHVFPSKSKVTNWLEMIQVAACDYRETSVARDKDGASIFVHICGIDYATANERFYIPFVANGGRTWTSSRQRRMGFLTDAKDVSHFFALIPCASKDNAKNAIDQYHVACNWVKEESVCRPAAEDLVRTWVKAGGSENAFSTSSDGTTTTTTTTTDINMFDTDRRRERSTSPVIKKTTATKKPLMKRLKDATATKKAKTTEVDFDVPVQPLQLTACLKGMVPIMLDDVSGVADPIKLAMPFRATVKTVPSKTEPEMVDYAIYVTVDSEAQKQDVLKIWNDARQTVWRECMTSFANLIGARFAHNDNVSCHTLYTPFIMAMDEQFRRISSDIKRPTGVMIGLIEKGARSMLSVTVANVGTADERAWVNGKWSEAMSTTNFHAPVDVLVESCRQTSPAAVVDEVTYNERLALSESIAALLQKMSDEQQLQFAHTVEADLSLRTLYGKDEKTGDWEVTLEVPMTRAMLADMTAIVTAAVERMVEQPVVAAAVEPTLKKPKHNGGSLKCTAQPTDEELLELTLKARENTETALVDLKDELSRMSGKVLVKDHVAAVAVDSLNGVDNAALKYSLDTAVILEELKRSVSDEASSSDDESYSEEEAAAEVLEPGEVVMTDAVEMETNLLDAEKKRLDTEREDRRKIAIGPHQAQLDVEKERARIAEEYEQLAAIAQVHEDERVASEKRARIAAEEHARIAAADKEQAEMERDEVVPVPGTFAAQMYEESDPDDSSYVPSDEEALEPGEIVMTDVEHVVEPAAVEPMRVATVEADIARKIAIDNVLFDSLPQHQAIVDVEAEGTRVAEEYEQSSSDNEDALLQAELAEAEQKRADLTRRLKEAAEARSLKKKIADEMEQIRLAKEKEAVRVKAEQERSRLAAEEEARVKDEQERARLAADAEEARLEAEKQERVVAEQTRLAEENARIAAEEEKARVEAAQKREREMTESRTALESQLTQMRLALEESDKARRAIAEQADRLMIQMQGIALAETEQKREEAARLTAAATEARRKENIAAMAASTAEKERRIAKQNADLAAAALAVKEDALQARAAERAQYNARLAAPVDETVVAHMTTSEYQLQQAGQAFVAVDATNTLDWAAF